ncbi:MAG: SPOR domain-containing protein [Methylotenera sp.]|nr:SPOR domain-containing protein [Methylotenera sp.]
MPPDADHDQELSLKKRARRRLVGAIGLVLLMVGVLPMVLQDRASLTPNPAIKITMAGVDAGVVEPIAPPVPLATPPASAVMPLASDAVNPLKEATVAVSNNAATEKRAAPADVTLAKPASTPVELKPVEEKPQSAPDVTAKVDDNAAAEKAKSSFAIQIGVYSSMASVSDLEAKLKQAGYVPSIKKVATDKGEKIRLRTGNYPTRQQAAEAMLKLQALGMPSMVVAND